MDRLQLLPKNGIVVVKVGTNVLTDAEGHLDEQRIISLAQQLLRIRETGRSVVLVSSGAIGAGVGLLGLKKRPSDLPHLQACAAVGQSALIQRYQHALSPAGCTVAQILLTAGDFENRGRYLNIRNTINTLFEYGALPIINENDTVSVAELKLSDNDHLAALVANVLPAPLLILLTNVDGLYSADPREVPNAELLSVVPAITRDVTNMASFRQSTLGTGGMRSKLRAARIATQAGTTVVMANGARDRVLDAIFAGETIGTLFLPEQEVVTARKRWLGYSARPAGELTLDPGAVRAIREKGRSLLPVGITHLHGDFHKGDILILRDQADHEVARGLSNYPASIARQILGLNAEQIRAKLGKLPYDELIHRNNLILT